MIYTKAETENVVSKTSMQPFDHLNNPMVICYSYFITKGLFGNEKLFTQNEKIGDIFVVYDWENEVIFDWAFTPELKGWSNDRGAELGTPKKYYSSEFYGTKIVELNPKTGMFTTYDAPMANTMITMNTANYTSDYGLRNFSIIDDDGKDHWQYYIFDTKTGKTFEQPLEKPADSTDIFYPMPDEKGVYWFTYTYQNKNYLISADCSQENPLSEPIFINDLDENEKVLEVILATDQYVLLGQLNSLGNLGYIKLYIKNSNKFIKIQMNEKFSDRYPFVYYAVSCCGKDYIISYIGTDNYIYSIDYENLKLIPETSNTFDYDNSVYVRESKIIFLDCIRDGFEIHYYDTKTKTWSINNKYNIESLVNTK